MKYDVFICYSSKNLEVAKSICQILENNGIKCWMAPRDIPVGKDYGDCIDSAILSCKIFLLVYSSEFLMSPWCKGEVSVAFEEGKSIIPYRVDTTPLKGAMRVILNQAHLIDSYPDFRGGFDELVRTVVRILGVEVKGDGKAQTPLVSSSVPIPPHPKPRVRWGLWAMITALVVAVIVGVPSKEDYFHLGLQAYETQDY